MKRKIKDYAIIFAVVVGFFLPLVLVDDRNCCWYRLRDWRFLHFRCFSVDYSQISR